MSTTRKSFPMLGNVTKEDLGKMSLKELTAMYNRCAEGAGAKVVKSFKDKPTALERTWGVGAEAKPEPASGKADKGEGGGKRGRKREALNLDAAEDRRPTRAGTAVSKILHCFGNGEGMTAEAVAKKVDKSVGYVRAVCRGIHESHGIGFRESADGIIKVVDRAGRAVEYTDAEPASKAKKTAAKAEQPAA